MNEYKLKGFLNELEDLMNRYNAEFQIDPDDTNDPVVILGVTLGEPKNAPIYHQIAEVYDYVGVIDAKKIKERN
jgi:hypothetical protein